MVIALFGIGAAFLLTNCQKNKDRDKEVILSVIAADTVWFNSKAQEDSSAGVGGSFFISDTTAAIIWWRGPKTYPAPIITIEIVGDSAYVEWSRGNVGKLNIWADTGGALVFWQKPLIETAKINVVFRQTGPVTEPDLKGLSSKTRSIPSMTWTVS